MKKTLILLTLAISTLCALPTDGPKINIRPACCRFEGWRGIELSVPNVSNSATNFQLQFKNTTNETNWQNVITHPDFGPFVEDGVWRYYFWFNTPTNNGVNQRYWRIVQ